jgi:hypothetical protein
VANEPVAVFVAISVPSSEIMQASMSKRWAWPPKVPTDETPLCRLLAATAQGVRMALVIVRIVMARTPPPTIRRSRLFGFCVTLCSRNGRSIATNTREVFAPWFLSTTLRPRAPPPSVLCTASCT